MSDKQQEVDWAPTLADIETNSPYKYAEKDGDIVVFLPDIDGIAGGIVGTIHTPAEWENITQNAHQTGVWPIRL